MAHQLVASSKLHIKQGEQTNWVAVLDIDADRAHSTKYAVGGPVESLCEAKSAAIYRKP